MFNVYCKKISLYRHNIGAKKVIMTKKVLEKNQDVLAVWSKN